jgi:hypothetical protein
MSSAVQPLPTSSWKPGDPATMSLISGTLAVEDSGALLVLPDGAAAAKVLLVWPSGYEARKDHRGAISVCDGSGSMVLSVGDSFTAGGGFVHRPGATPSSQPVSFYIMSTPRKASASSP